MAELWIIIEREFRERVQTRSFVIGTLAFPLFMMGIFLLPALVGDTQEQRQLAVIDRAPAGTGEVFVQALLASTQIAEASVAVAAGDSVPEPSVPAQPPYRIERFRGPDAPPADSLRARVLAGELDGYVVLPEDLMDGGEVVYRAQNITNRFVLRDIRIAATAAVQTRRLGAAGLDAAVVQRLMDPVSINTARITESGEEGGDATSTFLAAYLLAFVAYFIIAMYGHAVMRSVIQEKVTRISEILVSTVRATHLMAGKIAGVSAAALLQLAIWGALVALVLSRSDMLQESFGVPASVVDAFRLEPGVAVVLLLLFVLGFLLYASLFAALGAAMSTEQEAQPYQMVLMLPLFVPLIFLAPITTDPDGGLATFLGLFPLTAPVALPMKLAAAPADPVEVATALALLVATTILFAWIAGKIYRIGILATGKRPSLGELARWIRAA